MKRSDKKPLGCGICPYKTNSACHLERHLRIHTGQKPYACNMCSYRATDGGLLKRHMRIHSGEKPFTCSICGHKTAQSCSLKDHMAVHTGKKRYACEMCPFQCSRIGRLRDHQLHHQVVVIKSEVVTEHSSQPDEENPTIQKDEAKSKQCKFEFPGISDLSRHLTTENTKSEPPEVSEQTRLFHCTLCSAAVDTLDALNAHFSRHILYRCLDCESSFETQSELIAHGPVHSEEMIFNCDKCDFKSKTRNELRGHERVHNNSQSQICKECDFVSKSGTEFAQHLQTHTSTEMVQCNLCSTKFSKTSELREHMVIHYARSRARITRKPTTVRLSGEENVEGHLGTFHCYYCSYKCSQEHQMSKHIQVTHIGLSEQNGEKACEDQMNKPDEQHEGNDPDGAAGPSRPQEIHDASSSESKSNKIDHHSCPCTSHGSHCLRNLEFHYQHLSHFMNPNDTSEVFSQEAGKCRCYMDHQHTEGCGQKELHKLQFSRALHIDMCAPDSGATATRSHFTTEPRYEDDLLDDRTSKTESKRSVDGKYEKKSTCFLGKETDLKESPAKKIKTEDDLRKTHEQEAVQGNEKYGKLYQEKTKNAELLLAQLRQFFNESFPKMRSSSPAPRDCEQPRLTDLCTQSTLTIELSSDSNASDQSY